MGWERVRPQQNFSLNMDLLHLRQIPAAYPTQATEYSPGYRTDEPLHGIASLQPYPEQEILTNSNHSDRKYD